MSGERDEHGRFKEGNRGGPGRPRSETARPYTEQTRLRITLAEWSAIVDAAVVAAKKGDKAARQWISDELGTQRLIALDAELEAAAARLVAAASSTSAPPPDGEPYDVTPATSST